MSLGSTGFVLPYRGCRRRAAPIFSAVTGAFSAPLLSLPYLQTCLLHIKMGENRNRIFYTACSQGFIIAPAGERVVCRVSGPDLPTRLLA